MAEQAKDRIRGLLVKVGDERKKVVGNIKGLAAILQEDMADHRENIMLSLVECAKYLPTKSGVYGTWIALMNTNNRVFVSETINTLYAELRYAVGDGRLQISCCLLRVLIECANAGCLSATSVAAVMSSLLTSASASGFKNAEFGVYLVASSLPYFSPDLALSHPDVIALINSVISAVSTLTSESDYTVRRDLLSPLPGTPDRLQSATTLIEGLRSSGWSSDVLIRPYLLDGIKDQLSTTPSDSIHSLPIDDASFFESVASGKRFVPSVLIPAVSDDMKSLTPHDTLLLQDILATTVDQMDQHTGECAKALLRVPVIVPEFESVLASVLISKSLDTQSSVPRTFYHSVLLRCIVLQDSVTSHFEKAIVHLTAQPLSAEVEFAVAELLSFLITNNIKFTLLESVSESVMGKAGQYMSRLGFSNTLQPKLPESLHRLLPADPEMGTPFTHANGADDEAFRRVKEVVRIKDGSAVEVIEYLSSAVEGNKLGLFVEALIENGSKTLTHFRRLVEMYGGVLSQLGETPEEAGRVLVESLFAFWSESNEFRLERTLAIVLEAGLVDPRQIVGKIEMNEQKLISYRLAGVVVDHVRASGDAGMLGQILQAFLAKSDDGMQQWLVKKYHTLMMDGDDVHELLSLF